MSFKIFSCLAKDIINQFVFVLESNFQKGSNETPIKLPSVKLLEQVQVKEPLFITKAICNNFCQAWIGALYPSSLAHSIGNSDDSLGKHLVEVSENKFSEDISVLHRDSIYFMACQEA